MQQNLMKTDEQNKFLKILALRFEENMTRHPDVNWTEIELKILSEPSILLSVYKMEETGGEPDVVTFECCPEILYYIDCVKETPKERRSICYDNDALNSRKENKPLNSALGMAEEMGIEILTEDLYRKLQQKMELDTKTSSWVSTPEKIRKLGGALFCDRRYDTVFVYHNGAESYYSARGFRGLIKL